MQQRTDMPTTAQTSTILIVDDHAAGRESLAGPLSTQGYELIFASDGQEALRQVALYRPDLVLLDVMMPGIDGYEVCRRMRADPTLAEIPIIMVTALDDQGSRIMGLEAGADDFITKPVNRAEFRARVKTITRLNRYRNLHTQRLRLANVIEKSSEGYVLLSSSGTLLYANPQAQRILGVDDKLIASTDDKFVSLACRSYQLTPPAAWEGWPAVSSEADNQQRFLVYHETPYSPATWILVETLDLDAKNDGTLLVCLRDVSAQVTAARDIRRFHHMVSHKLNTPLYAVLGSLTLLAERPVIVADSGASELVALATDGANRLYAMLRGVLNYLSPPEAVTKEAGCPLSELPVLASELCRELDLAAPAVTVDSGLEFMQLTLTDSAISAILAELLENAKKFHAEHQPTIQIAISKKDPTTVAISVTDNGRWMSPQQIAHAWDLYYQGERYATGEVPGVGLGLSLVSSLVWGAGGNCRLYNRADLPGTVVEICLPVHDA